MDKIELLVKCARMFYEQRLTKSKIAEEIGFSVTHVKRLLDEASARGIVRISVVERRDSAAIENALRSKFSLKVARVAPSTPDYEQQKTALGGVAALLFDEVVEPNMSVGIGGGGSLKAMIEALPYLPREIRIAPMALVGRGPQIEYVDAAFLACLLFFKSAPKAQAWVVGMPPPPKDLSARKSLFRLIERSIPEVATVLNKAKGSSVSFVGLGGSEPVSELVPLLARTSRSDLIQRQAAGGINYNYFDDRGEELASLFQTVSIRDLKKMAADPDKRVILIAGGTHKTGPLEIALRAKIVNGLVTDEKTALRLTGSMSTESQH